MFHGPIQEATSDEPVGAVAQVMRAGDFSQVPVYEQDRFVGLLTAETVTRWLAAMLADGVGLVEEAPVREVLEHTEDPAHHCAFIARTASAFDALDAFDHHSAHGWSLDAIVITDGGGRDQRPLGIITTFDIPALLSALDGRTSGIG
jgi:CBS domain-containing protein